MAMNSLFVGLPLMLGNCLLVQQNRKVVKPLGTLGILERLFQMGIISEAEYKKKKAWYVETLLELYILDLITEDELKQKLNK